MAGLNHISGRKEVMMDPKWRHLSLTQKFKPKGYCIRLIIIIHNRMHSSAYVESEYIGVRHNTSHRYLWMILLKFLLRHRPTSRPWLPFHRKEATWYRNKRTKWNNKFKHNSLVRINQKRQYKLTHTRQLGSRTTSWLIHSSPRSRPQVYQQERTIQQIDSKVQLKRLQF